MTVMAPSVSLEPRPARRVTRIIVVLLTTLVLCAGMLTATAGEAKASTSFSPLRGITVGFDNSGSWANGHFWVVATDQAMLQAGARTAIGTACSRLIGEPFTGSPCAAAVDRLFASLDWRGWTNHGAWAEVYVSWLRVVNGRW